MKSLCLITRVSKKFRTNEAIAAIKKAQCRVILKVFTLDVNFLSYQYQGLSGEQQYEFWDLNVNFAYLQKTYPLQYAVSFRSFLASLTSLDKFYETFTL